ncbi:MAG: glycosyltransferase family 1 protein [Patescibacteria group bacterium]|nr:glycosyltransferase family 1 protein [Patescibacteria group bacterium]
MKRQIALISEHASPIAVLGGEDFGGQNVYVNKLSLELARLGFEVDVFTRRVSAEEPEIFSWVKGIRIINLKAGPLITLKKDFLLPYMSDFLSSFLNFYQKEKISYDLIHANFWMSGLVAVEIKKILGIPFVVTFHALGKIKKLYQKEADTSPKERVSIEYLVMKEADKIIAECPQDKEDLINLYGAQDEKIEVIPAGVDIKTFYPLSKVWARRKLGLDLQEKIILQLGRMVPRKGVASVISAMAQLTRQKDFPVRLVVVGGESDKPDPKRTPEIGRLTELAKSLGLEENVTFIGRRHGAELRQYYCASDVFVSTPWYEPFGLTVLEAMACGKPVIGSEVGGIKFTVKNNVTGFLVPPEEPFILAEKLTTLLTNENLQERFSKNALKNVYRRFTWPTVALMMASVYEKIIRQIEVVTKKEDPGAFNWSTVYFSSGRRKSASPGVLEGGKDD